MSLLAGGAISLGGGCGDDSDPSPGDTGPVVEVLHPDAPPLPGYDECTVVVTTNIQIPPWKHVNKCTAVEYPMNPPCGGDHWPVWAPYEKHTAPLPRPAYVHDEEHGAVVLLYSCPEGCPEVVTTLEQVFDEAPTDATCATLNPPVNARMLLAPDPEIPTPIAAAAWGATYTATCIDKASLSAFVERVYRKGPEDTCAAFHPLNPNADFLNCGGGGGDGGSGGGGGSGGSGGSGAGSGGGGGG